MSPYTQSESLPSSTSERSADLVVIGGGLGGVASALTVARLGRSVILTEADSWLGGQLTVQGVPPDEARWVESHPPSASYAEFRENVRQRYRQHFPRSEEHTSELQSRFDLVCRLLLEKKKKK